MLDEIRRIASEAEIATAPACHALWRRVVALAEADTSSPPSAEVTYLAGYGLYCLVDVEPLVLEQAERWLKRAVALRPDHRFAQLYLAHIAFDDGRFEEALVLLNSVPSDAFAAIDQRWRDLKVQELRICCLVQLSRLEALGTAFERYLSIARECDEMDFATVHELPALIASLVRRKDERP